MFNQYSAYIVAVLISLALIAIEQTSTTLSKSDKKKGKYREKSNSAEPREKWQGAIEQNVFDKGTGTNLRFIHIFLHARAEILLILVSGANFVR